MAEQATLFDLPNVPDNFGVILPPANLRKLDFSGLDYVTMRRAILEYIVTYHPDTFNDFAASNGIIMLIEIVAAVAAKLALRSDILSNEAFLLLAQSEAAVVNHLALINQRIRRQTPAVVDIEVSVERAIQTDVAIAPGMTFEVSGPDGRPVAYEIYRAPGDFTSNIVIPAGKRGVIAYGLEGRFANPVVLTSAGGPNQRFVISDTEILEGPILVDVLAGDTRERWQVLLEPIERYNATDPVVEVTFLGEQTIFRFGDNVTGAAPAAGQRVEIRYRTGGGVRGRIGVGQIDAVRSVFPAPPINASVQVRFRNITPSSGGTDKETLEQAKRRAPRDFAVRRAIVTADDYAQVASSFAHPVFGAVSKAVATVRTGLNANLVEVYVLVDGADGRPTAPNAGLVAGLQTYFDDLNVLTDKVVVLDGKIRPVNIDLTVVINRSSDATVIKEKVEAALTRYFDISQWELGQPLYTSNLIEAIEAIDGIAYIDLFAPANNVLQTGALAEAGSLGIGINELIVEGARQVSYYYEKVPR